MDAGVDRPPDHALNAYMYRKLDLDQALLERCNSCLVDAMGGGNQLTRKGIAAVIGAASIVASGFRLAYILMNAELNGVICSGAMKGRQHTYALLDERAQPVKSLTHDEAMAELTLRYFREHGPPTAKDFRR